MKDLTVLIGTCDKYEPLWKPFQICFNRYWKHNTRNIFSSQTKEVPLYTDTIFETVKSNKDTWASVILEAVDTITTKYIFFILDDYFLDYSYSEEQINEYIEFMDMNNVDRLQVSPSEFQIYTKIDGYEKYKRINKISSYYISMQPSIWNKDYIYKTLLPEYCPWEFEMTGSKKIKKQYAYLDDDDYIAIDYSMPSPYFNAVSRGFRRNPKWETFKQKENLEDF